MAGLEVGIQGQSSDTTFALLRVQALDTVFSLLLGVQDYSLPQLPLLEFVDLGMLLSFQKLVKMFFYQGRTCN